MLVGNASKTLIIHQSAVVLLLLASACSGTAGSPTPAVVSTPAPSATPTSPPPTPAPLRRAEPPNLALDPYEPSVELGNTTALNAAAVPFATYLVAIHNRIHPIFAEKLLASLDKLPRFAPDQRLVTHLEIVIDKDTGQIVRMGVLESSGARAFDLVALSTMKRAQPFGRAPDIIASPDGNVYVHWEFHSDPVDACSTRNARPFILKSAPQKALP